MPECVTSRNRPERFLECIANDQEQVEIRIPDASPAREESHVLDVRVGSDLAFLRAGDELPVNPEIVEGDIFDAVPSVMPGERRGDEGAAGQRDVAEDDALDMSPLDVLAPHIVVNDQLQQLDTGVLDADVVETHLAHRGPVAVLIPRAIGFV